MATYYTGKCLLLIRHKLASPVRFVDTTEPSLTCPAGGSITVTAEAGQTYAVVTWNEPVYGNDNVDGRIRLLYFTSYACTCTGVWRGNTIQIEAVEY